MHIPRNEYITNEITGLITQVNYLCLHLLYNTKAEMMLKQKL